MAPCAPVPCGVSVGRDKSDVACNPVVNKSRKDALARAAAWVVRDDVCRENHKQPQGMKCS